jgi:REP element-mobilizing transposase RayT
MAGCATVLTEKAMSQYKEYYARNLPHRQPPEATLFVTFRLDGAIPKPVLEQWRQQKKQLEMTLQRWAAFAPAGTVPDPAAVAEEKLTFNRRWFGKFEAILDGAKAGPLWLKDKPLAEIITEALQHRDGMIYRLDAYCVMPNHVHVVFAPFLTEALAVALAEKAIQQKRAVLHQLLPADTEEETCEFVLASIMESLKGWTARRCNQALNRSGQFWQHESYDHVIRTEAEWEGVVNYVVNNPVKAGFVTHWQDWQWSYRRPLPTDENGTPAQE